MYVNTRTLCKFIFNKSNKNLKHFKIIYDKNNRLLYNICDCKNISCCKKKLQK